MPFKNANPFWLAWGIAFAVSIAHGQNAKFLSIIQDTEISSALICSPDGQNVYAAGLFTIAAFKRQNDGTLATLQVLNNDHLGVHGIHYVIDLALSPDGRHLYAVNVNDQSLLIFARNRTTGVLELQETLVDSVFGKRRGGMPVLESNYKLLLSPNGKHLYWFYSGNGLLAVFAREALSGRLTKMQVLRNGASELNGFNIPHVIVITPDGKNIYGGRGNHSNIIVLARNPNSGKITYVDSSNINSLPAKLWEAGNIVASPDNSTILATDYVADKCLVFTRDLSTGKLQFAHEVIRNAPDRLVITPDGVDIYLLHYDSAKYIAHYKYDRIARQLLLINDRALRLQFNYPQPPSGICMSPQGDAIYLTSEAGRSVIKRDTTTGELSLLQYFQHNIGGTDRLLGARSVVVSLNDEYVYVSARGDDAGVSVFSRDQQSGELTLAAEDSVPEVTDMVMPPDGNCLYFSTNELKNNLEIVSCNAQTGEVKWSATQNNARLWPLTFSPDSRFFYNGNLVFERNPQSGELALRQEINSGNHGLGELRASAVSADGQFFYWSGEHPYYTRHQLALFTRDARSGQVAFKSMQEFQNSIPGRAMRLSPDGRHAYVSAYSEDFEYNTALRIFARQPDTGELTFRDNVYFSHWCELRDVEMTAAGDEVYVLLGCPGSYSGAIEIFTRDQETGLLTPRQSLIAWQNGVYGLIAPWDLAFSTDERFFYVADVSGVATFATGRLGTSLMDHEQNASRIPRALALEQNYPNPFSLLNTSSLAGHSVTTIHYEIPASISSAVPVELAIYDTQGRRVQMLVNATKTPGKYSVNWSGRNANGERLPAGVYFYRLKAGEQVLTRRLVVMR